MHWYLALQPYWYSKQHRWGDNPANADFFHGRPFGMPWSSKPAWRQVSVKPHGAPVLSHKLSGAWRPLWKSGTHLIHNDCLLDLQNACPRRHKQGCLSFLMRNSSGSSSIGLAGFPWECQDAPRSLQSCILFGGHYPEGFHMQLGLRGGTWGPEIIECERQKEPPEPSSLTHGPTLVRHSDYVSKSIFVDL